MSGRDSNFLQASIPRRIARETAEGPRRRAAGRAGGPALRLTRILAAVASAAALTAVMGLVGAAEADQVVSDLRAAAAAPLAGSQGAFGDGGTVTAVADQQGVDIRWQSESAAPGGFAIERGSRFRGRIASAEVARLPAGATAWRDPVKKGRFHYRVVARDADGATIAASDVVTVDVHVRQFDAAGTELPYDQPAIFVSKNRDLLDTADSLPPYPAVVVPSGDQRIDCLLDGSCIPGPDVTYSFATATGATPMSDGIKNNMRQVFAMVSTITTLSFREADWPAGDSHITITKYPPEAGGYAWGGSGMIGLNGAYDHASSTSGFQSPPGSHGYQALIHELGHNLGLKHTFDGEIHPPPGQENQSYTVMSYNFDTNEPATFMLNDVLALRYLYGTKSHRAADTPYRLIATSQYGINAETFYATTWVTKHCIWDTAGIDLLDASGLPASGGYRFDLRPGGFVSATAVFNGGPSPTIANGCAIDDGATIERIRATTSNDLILLAPGPNVVSGFPADRNTGNDVIEEAESQDTLDLSAYAAAQVTSARSGDDLVLTLGANGSVRVVGYYAGHQIRIKYAGTNGAPVANPIAISTDKDLPVDLALSGSDPEGDPLIFRVKTPPAHGTVSGDGATVTYTPAPGWWGTDSFTYTANDWRDASPEATVTITVRYVNHPAVVSAGRNRSFALPTQTITLKGSASDPEGQPLTLIWTKLSGPGAVTFGTPTQATTTATFAVAGDYALELSANDGNSTARSTTQVNVYPRVTAVPGADVNGGEPPLTVRFTGGVSGGDPGAPPLVFDAAKFVMYSTWYDSGGTVTTSGDSASVTLVNNVHKSHPLAAACAITPETMLEFDFNSSVQGSFHVIGLDSKSMVQFGSDFYPYQLYGTDYMGNADRTYNDYADCAPAIRHYSISLADYVGYRATHLLLLNNGAGSNSTYARVQIVERGDSLGYRYAWDFDGDGMTDSTERNPTHVYPAAGTYTVSLTVSDGYASDTKTRVVTVGPLDEIVIPLSAGYNLIAPPLIPAAPLTAEGWAQQINGQSPTPICTSVIGYSGGAFVTHPAGTAVNNFRIEVAQGYFLRCAAGGAWRAKGFRFVASSAVVPLETGYNLIGLPVEPVPADKYSAEGAGQEINAQGGGATQLIDYDTALGQFVTHPVGTAVSNFTLALGRGYFVRCTKGSTWLVSR
jgi:PKD repeat protein